MRGLLPQARRARAGRAARAAGGRLDLVYVSHIDQDHIGGVLQLLDDEVAWRVHDFQRARGNAGFPEPASRARRRSRESGTTRFHDVGRARTRGAIADAARGQRRRARAPAEAPSARVAAQQRGLATSIAEAIQLSARLGRGPARHPAQPRSSAASSRWSRPRRADRRARVGLRAHAARPVRGGPRAAARGSGTTGWTRTARRSSGCARGCRRTRSGSAASEIGAFRAVARGAARTSSGRRTSVTAPNLASLMLLAEEDGQARCCSPATGTRDDILEGSSTRGARPRRAHPRRRAQGPAPRLGAQPRRGLLPRASPPTTTSSARNGEHENPDLRIVRALVGAREAEGPAAGRTCSGSTAARRRPRTRRGGSTWPRSRRSPASSSGAAAGG